MNQVNDTGLSLKSITGDLFSDCGFFALQVLYDIFPGKHIVDLAYYVIDLYVDQWECNLYSFYANSSFTQPTYSRDKKKDEMRKYVDNLLTGNGIEGICRITGRKGSVFKMDRTNSILTSSSSLANYTPNFEGLWVCRDILLRNLFAPLACVQVGAYMVAFSSNDMKLIHSLIEQNVRRNIEIIGGVHKSEFSNIYSFLYNSCLLDVSQLHNTSLSVVSFSNFVNNIYYHELFISPIVFRFLSAVSKNKTFKKRWESFISSSYVVPQKIKAVYNRKEANYINKKGIAIEEPWKETWYNPVLRYLFEYKCFDYFINDPYRRYFRYFFKQSQDSDIRQYRDIFFSKPKI